MDKAMITLIAVVLGWALKVLSDRIGESRVTKTKLRKAIFNIVIFRQQILSRMDKLKLTEIARKRELSEAERQRIVGLGKPIMTAEETKIWLDHICECDPIIAVEISGLLKLANSAVNLDLSHYEKRPESYKTFVETQNLAYTGAAEKLRYHIISLSRRTGVFFEIRMRNFLNERDDRRGIIANLKKRLAEPQR